MLKVVLLNFCQWAFITQIKAQTPSLSPSLSPSSIAPTPVADRPTNGPRRFPHEAGPDHLRGHPIPTTIAPTAFVVPPPVVPVTHAPNARRAPHPTPPRGPTYPPQAGAPTSGLPCFSGHNTVHVKGKGVVTMKELAIGDEVFDVDGTFVTVYSFGHYDPLGTIEYILISVQGLDKPLEISKEHLLFQHGKAIPASLVAIGSQVDLGTTSDGETKKGIVKKIQFADRQGLFGPLTTSGTLLVNDVAVSSYITAQPDTGELLLFHKYPTGFSSHWLTHVYLTPRRWICTEVVGVDCCAKWETYNANGIASWIDASNARWTMVLDKSTPGSAKFMALASMVIWFAFALALYSLEQIGWKFMLALLVGPVVYSAILTKTRNRKLT